MPVGATNLPIHIAPAEQANLVQAVLQLQERTMLQAAAAASQDRGKQEVSEQVQTTRDVEGSTVQGDSRGAHSFQLGKESGEKESPAAEEPKPPDPSGLGQVFDMII